MIRVMPMAAIVEGHGEDAAVRILLMRLVSYVATDVHPDIRAVIRKGRQKLVKPGEIENAVQLAALRIANDRPALIVVLLDSDEDCPARLGPALLSRAIAARGDIRCSVVLAKHEYESWFAASAISMRGYRGIAQDLEPPDDPESMPSPKAWWESRVPGGYDPVRHQPGMTQRMDLQLARQAPSFDKLYRDISRLVGP